MPKGKPAPKLSAWTLKDEVNFINNLGKHTESFSGTALEVDTLLFRYKKALIARQSVSFDKTLALNAISRRQAEISEQVRREQAAYGLVAA